MTTWGIVATIKAPVSDTLGFVAYHLSQGAHHIYIYLDDANEEAFSRLKAHPQVTAHVTDDAWWAKRGRRPIKHQVRQSRNATHCYRRLARVDWLIHMDVDEFLVSATPLAAVLGALPDNALCARVRPMEQLAGDPALFKAFMPGGGTRLSMVDELYPTFGPYLKSGFLSHVAGKVFVRTGQSDLKLRIHNAMIGDEVISDAAELHDVNLAHAHVTSWEQFLGALNFRLDHGSYRADLPPERTRAGGSLTLHDLLSHLRENEGEAGLRAFFDEVCAATPRLIGALQDHDLLVSVDLRLRDHIREHFDIQT